MTKVDELIEQCGNAHSKGLIGVGRGEILYILNEAATALTDLQAQVAAGDSAKWQVKHTDTMNTLVQMGMARDQAEAECAALKAQVAAGNAALEQVQLIATNHSKWKVVSKIHRIAGQALAQVTGKDRDDGTA